MRAKARFEEMTSEHFKSLDYLAQRRYIEKLTIDGDVLPDPYSIADNLWIHDITKWPDLVYGDLYLIETKGPYTKEKLKAHKSLDAYSYFCSGHVCTVYFYGHGCSQSLGES